MSKVSVPKTVLDGLEAVRRSGLTNMLDRPVVARLAKEFGFPEAAKWVREHRRKYSRAIFVGFKLEEATRRMHDGR
ncbi:DUF5049 domain-containing protein [bacterium]|nr:MAG: DUF5049 domain-containing protein [bacterium]